MLKRIHIKGYKSLVDVEVDLNPLSLFLGPNTAGKSNFLDALQILSKVGSSKTLKDAFDPPYRGKPLESFYFGQEGLGGLIKQERVGFSIEADLNLSDTVVGDVERQIREMRSLGDESRSEGNGKTRTFVRDRNLRYRIEIEMRPGSGILCVANEYLAALNSKGNPTKKRNPFIERKGQKIHLRREGQAHPIYHERYLDHSILSMPHYPPHYPHLTAARRELESWLFYYFEPRERMRAPGRVGEVRHIGPMGEDLATFLYTLKARKARQFEAVEKSLQMLIPNIDGIDLDVNDLGEVELRLRENDVSASSRVISEGTLRMLGLLALTGIEDASALIGFEEPESGIHPRRVRLIAEFLNSRTSSESTQYIITTHSPLLPNMVPEESLYVVRRIDGKTRIDPFSIWGPLARKSDIDRALDDPELGEGDQSSRLRVSERILRGDLDA